MQRVRTGAFLTALDHLFLLRPMLLPPVWTIGLLGYEQGRRWTGGDAGESPLIPIALFSLLTGGVYVHNQITDIEGDRANQKLFLLADGYISERAATVQMLLCYGGAIGLSFLHSARLGGLMVVGGLLGLLYNSPRFRWKDRPVRGLVYNLCAYGGLAFAVGWLAAAPPVGWLIVHALPYCLGVGAIYLNTTLPDIPGDRLAGKITIGVRHGFQATCILACLFLAGGVLAGFLLGDGFIAIPSLVCLPLFVWMAVNGRVADVARATKIGVLALSMAAVIVSPPYLLVLTVLFFGAKPYYRLRFGLNYPTFRNR